MSEVTVSGGFPAAPVVSETVVAAIGGSAGSIPAFRDFFRNVPPDSGIAFVVVLHLSPEFESHLAEVLQSVSTIPVTQVSGPTKIEPNHVYVIPPNRSLSLRDDTLLLAPIIGFEERRAPIDIFFRALGESREAQAVCVILSGTGADGSSGLRRVKEYNGLVVVQEPNEAEYREMPRNAIATGLADFVLPAAEMPRCILDYREKLLANTRSYEAVDAAEDEEQSLLDIFRQLRVRTGQDFANYKRATVLRRIERRLAIREIAHLSEYARFMREQPAEADALLRELLISVTNFFRDGGVWEQVRKTVIPAIVQQKQPDDSIRAWVAGCATGEEAYSIGILFAEATTAMSYTPEIQIFATDLDEEAIAKARNGFYTATETADVSPERLLRYFVKEQGGFRVSREIRERVLFAHHNLLKDPPFSHLDLVSCRNLLIYLNRTAQERALELLHFSLESGGWLLLGTAETPDGPHQLFSTVDKDAHIYQSRAVPRTVTPPLRVQLTAAPDLRSVVAAGDVRANGRPSRSAAFDLHERLLEEYAAPSLIVDEQYNVIHLSERAGRYLQFASGEASLNLLQVIRPELRIDMRTALVQAAQKRTTVAARGVTITTGDRAETLNVVVHPALREGDPARGIFLVVFEPSADDNSAKTQIVAAGPPSPQMEEELIRIKGQMRITIEQYEVQAEEAKAANEELQAINEELRSTAEELETSQEELQSANEELQTVNQELKIKIEEITHANDDMRNLMSSTDIGTIFVDRALCVKLFTPRIREIFNLIPADVGRPLLDISSKVPVHDLAADLERVIERLQTIEREVATTEGKWHLMRLLPYRTAEDRIDGVVVTFVDITERKRDEDALLRSREQLEQRVLERTREVREATAMLQAIVDASPLAIIAVGSDRRVRTWNASAETMFGLAAADVMGKPMPEIATGGGAVQQTLIDAMFGGGSERTWETLLRRMDGTWLSVSIFPAPLRTPDGTVYAVMGLLQDITDRKRLEQDRERLLGRIVATQEDERQRLSRELHDEMGQHLTALKVGLAALDRPTTEVQRLQALAAEIDKSIDRLTLELRPPVLDDVGLDGAVATLVEQFTTSSGIRADLHSTGTDGQRLPSAIETTLYRVIQEGLTNIWKHAGAKNVSVIVERHPEQVQVIIEDDGSGFDENDFSSDADQARFGLLGMRERVALIGGSFSLESAPGHGTTLYVRVPLRGSTAGR
jgi:two-component system CheB/CheR fusion protein